MLKLFKLIGLPTILVLILILFNSFDILRNFPLGHSLLVQEYHKNIFTKFKTDKLLKGEVIAGQFTASEDNMSIALVRFFNFYHISKDQVLFRIKEKGKEEWYYQNPYKVDQFQPDQYFTIGFLPIVNSRDKTYIFEIESVSGVPLDAIGISSQAPHFAVAYKMNIQDLKNDYYLLGRFILKKSYFTISQLDFKNILLVYTLFIILNFLYWKYTDQINKTLNIIKIFCALTIKKIILLLSSQKVRRDLFDLLTKKRQALYNCILNSYIGIEKYLKHTNSKLKASRSLQILNKNVIISFLKRYKIILGIIFIFIVALLSRIEFYLNSNNFGTFFYSGLGGGGDYDLLVRHALSVFRSNDVVSYHWSFLNDHFFFSRFYWFLFNTFGFLNGLDYSVWFFILISSFVCTTPYILITRLKKFSFGGIFASLLFAIDPLSIWLSSVMIIDTSTAFTFSLFVVLFFLALEKLEFKLVILLGFVGFMDMFNRGLMFFNDGPALLLFTLFYLYLNINPPYMIVNMRNFIKNEIIFIKESYLDKKYLFKRHVKNWKILGNNLLRFIFKLRYKIIYALTPITVYAGLSILFDIYHQKTFGYPWPFRIESLYLDFVPATDVNNMLGGPAADVKSKLLNYVILQFLMLKELAEAIKIPFIFIIPFVLLILMQIKQKKHYLIFLLVILYVVIFYSFQQLLMTFNLGNIVGNYPMRIVTLENRDYFKIYVLLTFVVAQALLLKTVFPKLFLPVLVYLTALGYGIYVSFSDRHFIQVLLVEYFILAFALDKLFYSINDQRHKYINFSLIVVMVVVLSSYIGSTFLNIVSKIPSHIGYFYSEKKYLEHVESVLPKDAIILVGGGIENPIWISNYTKRTITYNSWLSSPVTIPYGEKDFHVGYSIKKAGMPMYDFTSEGSSGLYLREVLNDNSEFKKYKLYLLDYEIQKWNNYFSIIDYGHPFIKAHIFKLNLVGKSLNGRDIYQIMLLDEK